MAPGVDSNSITPISGFTVPPVQSTLLVNQSGQLYGSRNALGGQDPAAFGTTQTAMQMRLFADFQKYIDPDETPFTSSLSTGQAVNQKLVEWGTGFLMPNKATTTGAGIAGTTSPTTITFTSADHFNRVQLQQIIRNQTTGEHYMVLTKNSATNAITVQRGIGGTTPTADANARDLELLSPAVYENQDTTFVGVTKGALEYNYPQLMDLGIWVSNREDATPDYEFKSGSKYDAYLEKKMKEAAILWEKTAIYGRRSSTTPPEGVTTAAILPTTMGGLDQFTPLYYNLAGAPISEYVLENMLYESWDRVGEGNTPNRLLVGGFMRMAINSIWNNQRRATVKDKVTNLEWTRIETSFGNLEFTLSRYIPSGSAYLINTEDITIHPYKNGAWKEVKLPALGPYMRGRFTGDYTMMFKKTAARVKITGASTNPADYPNL